MVTSPANGSSQTASIRMSGSQTPRPWFLFTLLDVSQTPVWLRGRLKGSALTDPDDTQSHVAVARPGLSPATHSNPGGSDSVATPTGCYPIYLRSNGSLRERES